MSNDPTAAFTGVGASGTNPSSLSIPLGDQFDLWRNDPATVQRYTNPLGNLQQYLNALTPDQRARQAELLLRQPISTTMPESYAGQLPARADVIRAAAARYNLEPELVAAVILAEQRDQTRNEDAKDYTGATSLASANTSIGLGQVVISTARQTEDGFVVEPAGNQNREVRRPVIANVSLVKGDAPDDASLQTKSIGGRELRYRVTKSEGGSGGEVHTLNVFERVPGGHIKYSQAMQSEAGEPDFALCWTLVGSTKYRASL